MLAGSSDLDRADDRSARFSGRVRSPVGARSLGDRPDCGRVHAQDRLAPRRPITGRPIPGDRFALATLAALPVKGRAPRTGYDRDEFGQAWSDDVRASGGLNGCDQRNDVLRRDLTAITLKPGTHGCVVLTGTLEDPYSGAAIAFVRGPESADVQIDHVVALSDAWQSGAQQLDEDRRRDLAGDPLNLWAVGGRLNQSKGASNAASWLPPNRAVRCAYVARQVAVKAQYGLWVAEAEKDAISRVLAGCPGEPLPTQNALAVPDLG